MSNQGASGTGTGATAAEIEAAAETMWRAVRESNRDIEWPFPKDHPFAHIICDGQNAARDDAQEWAEALIPSGHRIAPPAVVEAIAGLCEAGEQIRPPFPPYIERVRAWLSGAGEGRG